VAAAGRLIRHQGYHGTVLHRHSGRGRVARGSLYFHFPAGKEKIGETAPTLAGEAVRRAIAHATETPETAGLFLTRIARGKSLQRRLPDRGHCARAIGAIRCAGRALKLLVIPSK
jgi:TetR/AcrR family transcriptional repressor of lmrAB and yxaGH operons